MHNSFSDEFFIRNFGHHHFPCIEENDDIVNLRTIVYRFVFLQSPTNKSFFKVNIQFPIRNNYFCCSDVIENFNFSFAFSTGSEAFFQIFEILNRIFDQILQFGFHFFHLRFEFQNCFICFVAVETCNPNHLNLCQTVQVFIYNVTHQLLLKRFESLVHVLKQG